MKYTTIPLFTKARLPVLMVIITIPNSYMNLWNKMSVLNM